jgi:hypothetical protein
MPRTAHHYAIRLLGASLLSIGLALAACSSSSTPNPVAPTAPPPQSAAVTQKITITADGAFPSILYVQPGYPVEVVNSDASVHMMHLTVSDEPGCTGFDLTGAVQPGESRSSGPITDEAVLCDVHDHMHHGDPRFLVQLVMSPSY